MPRTYTKRRRAESEAETRERIVDATIELHQTIGPNATTVSQIAERAGVGRVTVYRHFPDEPALSRACSGKYFEQHPPPDVERWREIDDPLARLRRGLGESLAYHAHTQQMMSHVLADARDHPAVAPYHAFWRHAGEVLAGPWPQRGDERALLLAGVALALGFDTWRTLEHEQGLEREQAVDLLVRLVAACQPQAVAEPDGAR
jgi:AcrR family transcriptional regulator